MSSYTQQAWQRWKADAAALLFLVALTLLFFRPVLFQGAWLPAGGGDNVSFIYPMYRFIAASLAQGELPLWNPYQYAGAPLIADNQAGIFYPPNLLLFLLKPDFSYAYIEALVIFHIFFAGAGAYFCARFLGGRARPAGAALEVMEESPISNLQSLPERLPRPAALIAAVAFMFSGLFLTHIGNLNLNAVAAWLPWVFLAFCWAADAGERRVGLRRAVVAGLVLGVSTLAGHGQISFYLALWLGVYALYRALRARSGRPLLLLALTGAVAFGLSALTLLPAVAMRAESLRQSFTYAEAANYSLPPAGLLGLLAPDFFGRSGNFWAAWPRVEYGYLGVLPWLLAAVGLGWDRVRGRRFLAGAALLFLLLALGRHTPVHRLFFTLLPAPFQVPARYVLLVDFAVALLAAAGAGRLLHGEGPRRWRFWLALGGALLLGALALLWAYSHWGALVPERRWQMGRALVIYGGLALAGWLLLLARARGWLASRLFGALALLLLAFDLISLGQYLEVAWEDPLRGYAYSPAVAFLQEEAGMARIDGAGGQWQRGAAQLFGLYAIDGVYNPLQLGRYTTYVGAVGYRGSPLYSLLGVEYVVGNPVEPPGDLNFIVPAFTADPVRAVYRNTRVLPRAFMVYESQVVADGAQAFAAIHEPAFDPARTVVLEEGRPLSGPPGRYEVEWLAYENNEARFRVTTDRAGYFLLSDIYYPGWKATVDGEEAPVLVADYAFRAVFLESGAHEVVMRFHPLGWRVGSILSILTTLLACLFLLGSHARVQKFVPYFTCILIDF